MDDLLHQAVLLGQQDLVRSALGRCEHIDSRNDNGETALLCAVESGHVDIVELLLREGADPLDGCHEDHECAIHRAATVGHVGIVSLLLEQGVHVDMTDNHGSTALMKAAANGHDDTVSFLLCSKADCNEINHEGLSALDYAVICGRLKVVKILLDSGASIYQPGQRETTLHLAAEANRQDLMAVLLSLATAEDVNRADENDHMPLHRACQVEESCTIDLLIKHGANVNATDKFGLMPLHLVAEQGNAIGAEILLDNNASIDAVDKGNKTPLALAAMQGRMFFCSGSTNLDVDSHFDLIDLLIQRQANLNIADSCGRTPLYLAAERGCIRASTRLITCGANVHVVDLIDASTPLHHAVRHSSVELVEALINAGVQVNCKDTLTSRPLDLISSSVRTATTILHLLLKAGAEYRKVNHDIAITLQIRQQETAGLLLLMHGATLREFKKADFDNRTSWGQDIFKKHSHLHDLCMQHRPYSELLNGITNTETVQAARKLTPKQTSFNTLSLFELAVVAIREWLLLIEQGRSVWKAVIGLHLPRSLQNALLLKKLDTDSQLTHIE